MDTIYYDIKLYHSQEHEQHCGASNKRILDNFAKLYSHSKNGGVQVLPRTPLIPEITDTPSNLGSIADFLKQHQVKQMQLMEYNPLWFEKNHKIGLKTIYPTEGMKTWMSREKIKQCQQIFQQANIELI